MTSFDNNVFHLGSLGGEGSVERRFEGSIKDGFAGGIGLAGDAVQLDSVADLMRLFLEAIGLLCSGTSSPVKVTATDVTEAKAAQLLLRRFSAK